MSEEEKRKTINNALVFAPIMRFANEEKSPKNSFARDPQKNVKKVAKKLTSYDKKTLLLAVEVPKWINFEREFHSEDIIPKRRMKIHYNLVEKLKYCHEDKFEETLDDIISKRINFKAL